ncbi:MAG: Rrf2 family transcriptional regulator [SAR324 cluster bacterium]|nr:Rrf2 family transcriptional regulator [SAR324 cluster bacterium]
MLKFNKSTVFALYAIMELSRDPQKVISAGQIAGKYKISEHHVAKVLQQLKRIGLIRSIRGINGGFQIAKAPKEITVLDVVEMFESSSSNAPNLLETGENCFDTESCEIENLFSEINELVYFTLKSVSFATLVSPKKIS